MNANLTTRVKSLKHQLNTERRYLDVLMKDFAAVYHVNLKDDTSKLVKVDSQIAGYDAVKVSLRQTNRFTERVEAYSNKFVIPGMREEFRKVLSLANAGRDSE